MYLKDSLEFKLWLQRLISSAGRQNSRLCDGCFIKNTLVPPLLEQECFLDLIGRSPVTHRAVTAWCLPLAAVLEISPI